MLGFVFGTRSHELAVSNRDRDLAHLMVLEADNVLNQVHIHALEDMSRRENYVHVLALGTA